MTYEAIRYEAADGVGTITLNRPDVHNAMNEAMRRDLYACFAGLITDDSVRVVVVTGSGDKAFVSGTDIRQFQAFKTRQDALGYEARISRVLNRLAAVTKPTIAMIQGDAVGGGMFMALACDLRLAAEHARFGAPIARTLGNFAAPASLALLIATVGPIRAREMVITARLIAAGEAQAMGLVDQVHPAAELSARTRELAARIGQHAPLTMAAVKEATRRYIAGVAPKDLEDLILSCYLSQDFQEGVRAFLDKRKPDWQGR